MKPHNRISIKKLDKINRKNHIKYLRKEFIDNKKYILELDPQKYFLNEDEDFNNFGNIGNIKLKKDINNNFKIVVSDTQIYKQAGNSIVVNVLEELIKTINLFVPH